MSLNNKQKEAIETIEGPVLILAGAGSGKTTVLTHRICHLLEIGRGPEEILALTFTNKAAEEMRDRITKLLGREKAEKIWMSTFHSMCSKILKSEAEYIPGLKENFSIYEAQEAKNLIKRVIKQEGIKGIYASDAYTMISKIKNELVDVESLKFMYPSNHYIDWEKALEVIEKKIPEQKRKMVSRIYESYQKELIRNNAVDFDDLILYVTKIFIEQQKVLKKYQERFCYIMIDEYQDTNHAQYVLANLLAKKERNIAVVGDDGQSIYAFRGSDIRNILEFENDYPDAKVIKLEENYRCTPTILKAANQIISKNKNQRKKKLYTKNGEGEKIGYYHAFDEKDEARYVINEIKQKIKKGEKYKNFAILVRMNNQIKVFEEMFMRNSMPYQLIGETSIYEKQEIKYILNYLMFANNNNDRFLFRSILEKTNKQNEKEWIEKLIETKEKDFFSYLKDEEKKFVSKKQEKELRHFCELIEKVQKKIKEKKVTEAITLILLENPFLNKEQHEVVLKEKLSSIAELMNVAILYENENSSISFLEYIQKIQEIEENLEEESIKIMTLHAAKGLEFKHVFLVGMEEGIFPHKHAESGEGIEEERRLCYVGFTRAMKKLYLTHANTRKSFGKKENHAPSRFLFEFDHDAIDNRYPIVKTS